MEVFGKSADKAKRDNDKIGRMFAKMGLLLAAVSEILLLVSQILDENEYSTRFHIEYELSNEDQIREELLKEALLDSKKKAEDLAEALNMTVIGVKSVEAYSKLNGRTEGIASHVKGRFVIIWAYHSFHIQINYRQRKKNYRSLLR